MKYSYITAALLFAVILAPEAQAKSNGFAAVQRAAIHEHVPVKLAMAVAHRESSGNCRASSGIAFGVMQVKPATAHSVGVLGNLRNCETGALAGVRYLKKALKAARGSWALAAHFYNAGVGAPPRYSRYAYNVMSTVRHNYY